MHECMALRSSVSHSLVYGLDECSVVGLTKGPLDRLHDSTMTSKQDK